MLRALPLRQPLHAQGAYFRTKTTQRGALFGLISFEVASPSESWRLTWLSHWIAALDQVCTQVPLDRTLILTVSFSGMKQGSRPLRIHRLLASYVSSWSNRASPLVRLSSTHTWPENHFSLRHESALHPAFCPEPPQTTRFCTALQLPNCFCGERYRLSSSPLSMEAGTTCETAGLFSWSAFLRYQT